MYNIFYTYDGMLRKYCIRDMDYVTAQKMLSLWVSKYWDEKKEKAKAYPNGRGFYPVSKAYIAEV